MIQQPDEEVKKSTILTLVKNNNTQAVVYSKNHQRDNTVFKSAKTDLQVDEDQEFFSANGERNEFQDLIITEEDDNFRTPKAETEKIPSQYEKAKIAANKEKVIFKSAL